MRAKPCYFIILYRVYFTLKLIFYTLYGINSEKFLYLYPNRYKFQYEQPVGNGKIAAQAISLKSGVGLRFVRDLEQGKQTLRLDKVNQLLDFFNYEMAPQPKQNR